MKSLTPNKESDENTSDSLKEFLKPSTLRKTTTSASKPTTMPTFFSTPSSSSSFFSIGKPCKFNIRTITGKTFKINMFTKSTLGEIKAEIEDEEGIPANSIKLVYRDKELKNDFATVEEMGIPNLATLTLLVEMVGGPGIPSKSTNSESLVLIVCRENNDLYMVELDGANGNGAPRQLIKIASGHNLSKPLLELLEIDDMAETLSGEKEEKDPFPLEEDIQQPSSDGESSRPSSQQTRKKRITFSAGSSRMSVTRPSTSDSTTSTDSFLNLLSLCDINPEDLENPEETLSLSPSSSSVLEKLEAIAKEEFSTSGARCQSAKSLLRRQSLDSSSLILDLNGQRPVTAISIMRVNKEPSIILPKSRPASCKNFYKPDFSKSSSSTTSLSSTSTLPTQKLSSSSSMSSFASFIPVPTSQSSTPTTTTKVKTPPRAKTPFMPTRKVKTPRSSVSMTNISKLADEDTQPVIKEFQTTSSSNIPRKATSKQCCQCRRRLTPAGTFSCQCHQVFCASHRLQEQHACVALKDKKKLEFERNAEKLMANSCFSKVHAFA